MENEESAVEAVSRIGTPQLSLQASADATNSEALRALSFSRVAEDAIARAVERPNVQSQIDETRADIVGASDGVVGDLKSGVVSSVERPGAERLDDATASDDLQAQTETRVRELYYDLTNYQVAWKIAQRIQQDITQLLRG